MTINKNKKINHFGVILLSMVLLLFSSCFTNESQETNLVNNNAQNAISQQVPQPNQEQKNKPNSVAQRPTLKTKSTKVSGAPNPNFKVTLDEDMKAQLNEANKDKKQVSKAKFEADYFVNYINGIVQLTKEQKESIGKLATENIQIKLRLQDQLKALKSAPNKDFKKIRAVARSIAFQHQEEVAYLEKELTPSQFKKYTEHQESKMKKARK